MGQPGGCCSYPPTSGATRRTLTISESPGEAPKKSWEFRSHHVRRSIDGQQGDNAMTLVRVGTLILLLLALSPPAHAQDPSPAEEAKIQKIVRDYLRAHPEVIVDALQEY